MVLAHDIKKKIPEETPKHKHTGMDRKALWASLKNLMRDIFSLGDNHILIIFSIVKIYLVWLDGDQQ